MSDIPTAWPTVRIANPDLPAEVGAIIAAVEEMAAAADGIGARLESGETVFIEGLDSRMRAVHAAVENCEEEDASPRLMPSLRILADSLERMEKALKAHKPRPVPTTAPRKAAEAYGAAPKPPAKS